MDLLNTEWLARNLVCPRDHTSLTLEPQRLVCANGHVYPRVEGIPVLLLEELPHTLNSYALTMEEVQTRQYWDGPLDPDQIDPFVQNGIVGKCGNLYQSLAGRLPRYPIPELPLPAASGDIFLDVGCGWGRWCISAAQKGYSAVGIDSGLDSILAARRVSRQLALPITYLLADARRLPFRDACMDAAFSYSVLQHFSPPDAHLAFAEIARVLKPGAISLVQMAAAWGIRSIYRRLARVLAHRSQSDFFRVHYWRPRDLKRAFTQCIGPSTLAADGFFGLNLQPSDIDLLPPRYRALVRASGVLRKLSRRVPLLTNVADSVFIRSVRPPIR